MCVAGEWWWLYLQLVLATILIWWTRAQPSICEEEYSAFFWTLLYCLDTYPILKIGCRKAMSRIIPIVSGKVADICLEQSEKCWHWTYRRKYAALSPYQDTFTLNSLSPVPRNKAAKSVLTSPDLQTPGGEGGREHGLGYLCCMMCSDLSSLSDTTISHPPPLYFDPSVGQ